MYAYEDKKQSTTDRKKIDAHRIPSQMRTAAPNATGIPYTAKTRFENLSGFSFDDVRVHYNSSKPAQLQALAYTQGNQVYVGPGQENHLGYELGHVVQQKLGIVKPTNVINGIKINDNADLEKAANMHDFTKIISNYEMDKRNRFYDDTIQRMPFSDMIYDLFDQFKGKSVKEESLIQKLENLLEIPIIKNMSIENSDFMDLIDFEKTDSTEGGGAYFIPRKNKYIIGYNVTHLWKKCEDFFPKTDKEFLTKVATMVVANIQHELTHAAVAVSMHKSDGITEAEYVKIQGMTQETKDDELIKKYRSFSENTILKELLPKVNEICGYLKISLSKENMSSKSFAIEYLSNRLSYMQRNDAMEIDSVLTDLCYYFNMNYPEIRTTDCLNRFATLCKSLRKEGMRKEDAETLLSALQTFITSYKK